MRLSTGGENGEVTTDPFASLGPFTGGYELRADDREQDQRVDLAGVAEARREQLVGNGADASEVSQHHRTGSVDNGQRLGHEGGHRSNRVGR